LIWIEMLTPEMEVASRTRVGEGATLGRGYDNDFVIDDPYAARRHARLRRNEDNLLLIEDTGSLNGICDESGKRRHAMLLTGSTLFRIGQAWLRVREASFFVDTERPLPPPRRVWPGLLLALVLAAVVNVLILWAGDAGQSDPLTHYVRPLSGIALAMVVWIVFWAANTCLFTGRSRTAAHAVVALIALAVIPALDVLRDWASYALASRALADDAFVCCALALAIVVYAHLRIASARHLAFKAGVTALLAGCICLTFWLGVQPVLSGAQSAARFSPVRLYPPAWRIAPAETDDVFFGEMEKARAAADARRK
jgi:hypothetical protein